MPDTNQIQEQIMKNLGKLLILVLVFAITTESYSQKFGIGIKGGLNLSNLHNNDDRGADYSTVDYKIKPGFHIGATVEIPIYKVLSLETGLLMSSQGYRSTYTDIFEFEKGKESLFSLYLNIPLAAKVTFSAGHVKIYGAIGPYIGIGLFGKFKWDFPLDSDSETVSWGSDPDSDHFKRLDYGLIGGPGIEIKSLQIGLSYGLGLRNISPEEGVKASNRVLRLSVGYKFGAK